MKPALIFWTVKTDSLKDWGENEEEEALLDQLRSIRSYIAPPKHYLDKALSQNSR